MKRFAKGVFCILSFICGMFMTTNSARYEHLKVIGQEFNLTDGGRIRRNYGYGASANNYGNYPENYEGYNNHEHSNHNNNNNYGKRYSCCHCDSGGSSPLLFFGLGSLLGLLFAMPMMMAGNGTPMPVTPPIVFRSERSELNHLERSRRIHSYVIPAKRKEIERNTVQSVIINVLGKPECIKHWFCELYQHVHFILPKNKMKMTKLLIESVEKLEDFKSCKNLSSNYCKKLI